MSKGISVKIAILFCFMCCFFVSSSSVLAEKISEEEYDHFDKMIEEIQKQLQFIDDRLNMVRQTGEFAKYPAVRLNIDTPLFGLKSIIDSKLKIIDGVSPFDIASNYGIQSIVENKVVKVETMDVATIVIMTRDIKIQKEMEREDAYHAMAILMGCYNKVLEAQEFLSIQLATFFRDYFPKEKIELMNKINDEIRVAEKNGQELDGILSQYMVLNFEKDFSSYYNYPNKVEEYKTMIKNIFLTTEKLDEIHMNLIEFNNTIKYTVESLKESYNVEYKQVKYQECIKNLYTDIRERLEKIQSYQAKTNYFMYDSTMYNHLLEELQKVSDILLFAGENSVITLYDMNTTGDVSNLTSPYLSFLEKENSFYLDSIMKIVKEIKKLPKLEISKFDYMKYLYIDMPQQLDTMYLSYNKNSIISNVRNINSALEVLNKVMEINQYIVDSEREKNAQNQ